MSNIRHKLLWLLKGTLMFIVSLLFVGCAYQALSSNSDRSRYPAPGNFVSVGSHKMHIQCQGEGDPTVVFDAGLGGWSIHWRSLMTRVAENTRACAYDRTGMGWSDFGTGQFDADTAARELHALLSNSKIEFPIIFVGHSFGANVGEVYASKFPETVHGLVLIEPGLPADMLEDYKGTQQEALNIDSCGWKCAVSKTMARLGIVRLLAKFAGSKLMDEQTNAEYRAGTSQPKTVGTMIGYLVFMPKTAYQIDPIDTFEDIPLRVVASSAKGLDEEDQDWHQTVMTHYSDLARLSSRGIGPIVIDDTSHMSVVLAPRAVEELAQIIIELK